MAKSKKSKILASMLAVSTMAVFYATPVMAGSVNSITGNSSGIHFDFGYEKDDNTSISGGEISGSDGIYVAGPAGNEIGGVTHTIVGKFTITSDAVINALEGKTFNDLTINNLDTTNLTVNGETVDLSQLADVDLSNVKGITRSAGATTPGTGTTTIEGVLSVDGTTGEIYNSGSTFGVDADGNVAAVSVTTSGDVSTGRYTLNTVGADLDTVEARTQKITYAASADTTNISGRVVAGGVTLNGGNVNTTGTVAAKEFANSSGDTLGGVADDVDAVTLSVAEVAEKTQNMTATPGNTSFTGNVNVDGKLVAEKFGNANDSFWVTKDGAISAANDKFYVGTSGEVKAANGNFEIRNNGNVVLRDGATVDGVDVSELSTAVGETNKNVAGIVRDGEGAPGEATTTIEGGTEISANVVNGNVYGQVKTDTVLATTGQFGKVLITGDSLNNVGFINGAAVSGSNGALTVSGVELNNGSVRGHRFAFDDNTFTLYNGSDSWKTFEVNSDQGTVMAANGNFKVDAYGNVALAENATVDGVDVSELSSSVEGTATDVSNLKHKTQNINMEGTNEYTTMFDGNVIASGTIGNGRFMATNDGNVTGNVFTGSNFVTNDGADLNKIAQNTSGISKTAADTKVEGVGFYNGRMDADAVVTDELTVNGLSNLDGVRIQNGSIYAANDSYVGGVQLAGGLVDGVDVSELSTTVGETNKNVAGIVRDGEGAPGEGTTTIEGATSFDANGMNVGNGAVVANTDGNVYATGDVVSSYGDKGYSLNTIGENTQSIKYSDGVTTIGGNTLAVNDNGYVTINNGAFAVGPDGMATVGQNIQLDGENGLITATDLYATSNVYSENYNLEDVGADLADLSGNFAETNANVAGIERFGEGAPGEGITTIEDGALFVSKDITYMNSGDAMVQTSTDSAYMSFGDNMISVNKGGINLVGSVGFTGHDGGRYTLSDLEGRVYDLEQKTQNITSSEPGQGGDPSVPPTTAGETGIVGDVTVGGDLTVNGDGNIGGVGLADGKVTANEGTFNKGTFGSGENQTVIDSNGVTVGTIDENGKGGTSIKHDEITVGDGGYIGGGDVVSGEGTSLNNTADRVTNLEQGVSDLSSKVNELDDRIDKVGAMAAAIANLRTMGYDPAAPTEVAVGLGQYRDETGAALGLFHYPNRDFMLSLSVSTSGDEVMGGIGATWKFGRKSPEKVAEIKKAQAEADVRRAEEAKLAKAEEMKKAAKEAKIKAQQERHAKLAAERAAQAEAK